MSLNPAQLTEAKPATAVSCQCGCLTRTRRYPTDMTDAQWAILEPLLPVPACQLPSGGRPERHHRRAVLDAIFYLVDNGVKWRALPADFPPWRTVYGLFARWSDNLNTIELTDRLRANLRQALGRNPQPSAGCIDSQSVAETAEATVPTSTSGFDPYKRVNGRKRHITVDTLGLLLGVVVTPANVQDQHAARALLADADRHGITHLWADKGYHVDALITTAKELWDITIEIVRRDPTIRGLQILPRRWVVERTFAWTSRRRRCARDYERLTDHHETMTHWAAILTMTRRRARHP
ncbi:IS5 family transposase [Phytohabitans flavus]|uniref:Transposase n=2 Tax=Phytohabitans flavus TaxID=1076124 RepID=A0A6F8XZ26_9ACTN|nr:IS5 family transposase [Phytohabitans flavus]BCB77488.1 transposase [Phytohabitans flavus]BCB79060.1 transposase [Phytohabitans flavus]BCB82580.1 transposase [Phytohabitans flavus]